MSDLSGINRNQLAFLRGLGMTESGFRRKEAYAEYLNKPHNNANVRKYGPSGADYGYYQTNARDVADAIRLGVPKEVAQHLNGGGAGGQSTQAQQTAAMHAYLERRYPREYGGLVSGRPEAFEAARQRMSGQWFGLRDNPAVARREFTRGGDPALFVDGPMPASSRTASAATAPLAQPTSPSAPRRQSTENYGWGGMRSIGEGMRALGGPKNGQPQQSGGLLGKLFGGGEGGGPQGATFVNDHYGNGIQWGDGSRNYQGGGSFMPGAVTGSPRSPTYNQSGQSEPMIAPTPELPTYPATMPGAAPHAPSGVTSVKPTSTPQQPKPPTPIPGAQPPSSLGAPLPPAADPVPSMPGAQEPPTRSALGSRLAPQAQPMAAPVQTPADPPPPTMPGAEPQPLRRRDENGNEYPARKPYMRTDMPQWQDQRSTRRSSIMPGGGPNVANTIGAATPIPGTPPMLGQPLEMPGAMPRMIPQNALFKSIFGGM